MNFGRLYLLHNPISVRNGTQVTHRCIETKRSEQGNRELYISSSGRVPTLLRTAINGNPAVPHIPQITSETSVSGSSKTKTPEHTQNGLERGPVMTVVATLQPKVRPVRPDGTRIPARQDERITIMYTRSTMLERRAAK